METGRRPAQNDLLSVLPPDYIASLYQRFETVELRRLDVLANPGEPLKSALFPHSGIVAVLQTLEDGMSVEVGLVGREGFLGLPLLSGAGSSPAEAIVQNDGVALSIPAAFFVAECRRNEKLHSLVSRYAHAMLAQVMQTAACNARHPLMQRLARWLLEAHDRSDENEMRLGHEQISSMLGCRRAGVSEALAALRVSGALEVSNKSVRIKDRRQLEAAACLCYQTVRSEFARVLPMKTP